MESKIDKSEKQLQIKNINIIRLLYQLWILFNPKTKKLIIKTIFLGIILAFLEVITIFSIIPILELLSLEENKTNFIFKFVDFDNGYSLIIPIFIFLLFLAFVTWMKFYVQEKIYSFTALIDNSISFSTYKRIIYPESNLDFLSSGVSKVLTTMYDDIQKAVRTISNVVILFINLICLISILSILLFREPYFTLFALFILLIAYSFILNYSNQWFIDASFKSRNQIKKIFSHITLTFGMFREIKIRNLENKFENKYKNIDYRYRELVAKTAFKQVSSKFIIEAVLISIILFILYIKLLFLNKTIGQIVIELGFIAAVFQKIVPYVQQSYTGNTSIKSKKKSLIVIRNILKNKISDNVNILEKNKLKEFKKIKIDNINFTQNGIPIFNKASVEMYINNLYLIRGVSGSGKSTLLNIISSFINPDNADYFINDKKLSFKGYKEFIIQNKILSYVPQEPYLLNSTIRENINILSKNKFVDQLIRKILKVSCIEKINENQGDILDYEIGENGAFLSGGQKQRIAIARSIILKPKILILDESTSGIEEKLQSRLVNNLRKYNDMILIVESHRDSLLNLCDEIIEVSDL